MFLVEKNSKMIFKEHGIIVPRGRAAIDPLGIMQVATELNRPVVLKALVASGGRGKLGGIRFADTPPEALAEGDRLLSMKLAGQKVAAVLVEERIYPEQELYLGITIDLVESRPLVIFSTGGGVDIEEEASGIYKYYLDLFNPVKYPLLLDFIRTSCLAERYCAKVADLLERLVGIFFNYDALMVEINPLMVTADKEVIAADAKMVIDDSAKFRHKQLPWGNQTFQLHPLEREAEESGLSLVLFNGGGDIGLVCGGAGLGMATVDTLAYYGGKTANFLDTGGGLSVEKMVKAMKIVFKIPGIKGILVNVFGGINNCLNMAQGLAEAIENRDRDDLQLPIVVKMQGHFQEEGWALLEKYSQVTVIKKGYIDDAVIKILSLTEAAD